MYISINLTWALPCSFDPLLACYSGLRLYPRGNSLVFRRSVICADICRNSPCSTRGWLCSIRMARVSYCELMLLPEISHLRLPYCSWDTIYPQFDACTKTLCLQGVLCSELSRPFRDFMMHQDYKRYNISDRMSLPSNCKLSISACFWTSVIFMACDMHEVDGVTVLKCSLVGEDRRSASIVRCPKKLCFSGYMNACRSNTQGLISVY